MTTAPEPDEFTEALGVYVGPATQHEVTQAIGVHDQPCLVRMSAADGTLMWHRDGLVELWVTGWRKANEPADDDEDDDDRETTFIITDQQTAGNPVIITDALVLSFAGSWAERFKAELYTGGVRLWPTFMPYDGCELTIVFWRSLMQENEDGDIVPGISFGTFTVETSDEDDDVT